ncbi:hypothetical protein IHE45_07G040100 [Dioscorea alata]|uniref:Uncharacterized protein n=1 Tax=Dioscorea alata TaxID=55571 RepID=A0ACB7VQG1_DIOAL|nr:hypothetical protein IHE45_07G040100 [Dioscorea alata]
MGGILSLCRSFGLCFGVGGGGAEEAALVPEQEFAREEPANQEPSSSTTDDMNKAFSILKEFMERSNIIADNFFNEHLTQAPPIADTFCVNDCVVMN